MSHQFNREPMLRLNWLSTMLLLIVLFVGGSVRIEAAETDRAALQDKFDQATKEFELQRWAEAARLYNEFRKAAPDTRSMAVAVAAVREGHSLVRLDKTAAALPVLEVGLEKFPPNPELRADQVLGWQDWALANEREHDLGLAARGYAKLVPLVEGDPTASEAALLGLARTAMFDDPEKAISAANRATARKSGNAEHDARLSATALDLRGRAELIAGSKTEAIRTLRQAFALAGGMTRQIDALDASIRADLGLALLLAGDEKSANAFIAATGVARSPRTFLFSPSILNVLECREDQKPEDFAIVELSIGPDGVPQNVWPIYSTRLGDFAGSLASTVKLMRWAPRAVADLRPFQAQTVRIEAHCEVPPLDTSLLRNGTPLQLWIKSKGLPAFPTRLIDTENELRSARAELARREQQHGVSSIMLMPLLDSIASSPLVSNLETRRIRAREATIAKMAHAPASVFADLEFRDLRGSDEELIAYLDQMLVDPRYASDAESRDFLLFQRTWIHASTTRDDGDLQALRMIAADERLTSDHAIRRMAKLGLYFLDWKSKGQPTRLNYLRDAGIGDSPCTLFVLTPAEKVVDRFYPEESRQWGFGGWSMIELDLDSAGKAVKMRTVYAYPPLIFRDAARRASATFRFRTRSGLKPINGCAGKTQAVYFGLM